ncbi:MAG: hypothetical protein HPY73_06200 [Methanomassiliicoccales archaeon]|nr:MAG: hypothetical protein HPY73_06200 [Methanomassiliicoccales archaeon]
MRVARAFCPGHITGFFQIFRHEDPLSTGSRGAGLSIALGAESRVLIEKGREGAEVIINGERVRARVTEQAVGSLLAGEGMTAKVWTNLALPISQGFGMSAAGALSAALAVSELLGKDEDAAYRAVHEAEIANGTGLGDIAAIRCGGVEFRRKEGLQPYGEVLRLDGHFDLLLCVVGPRIETADVILDDQKARMINIAGADCIERFGKGPGIEELFELSREFSERSGLITGNVRRAFSSVKDDERVAMCMVGNSVFATGPDLIGLYERLAKLGPVFRTSVDEKGPRLL